jgi:hypothetical protein
MTFSLLPQGDDRSNREERNESQGGLTKQPYSPNETVSNIPSPAVSRKEEVKASGNNVGALVAKSKKAAASLCTLLHAKNCRLGVNRCSHSGCPEAKLMYLHLKTCTAGPGSSCPTKHKGCEDARKLLAHYRRCRDIRSRQANNPKVQQHVCLVCTLAARHVKGTSDRTTRSTSPRSRNSKHLIPSLNLSSDADTKNPNQSRHPGLVRPRSASPSKTGNGTMASSLTFIQNGSSFTPKKMPPPPPRFPFSSRIVCNEKQPPCDMGCISDGSAANRVMHSAMYHALKADEAADPADETMLGKSLDSASGFSRSRAQSLDIRRSPAMTQGVGWRNDQSPETNDFGEEKLSASEELQTEPRVQGRRRSASCSVLSPSSSSQTICDTILEEPVGEELQRILEGDS